ncbi:uncharacterized protein LOC141622686 [Silene latifolia]|uniref:uncharacterized protein LOC141622686 n=1 Tax=Silene latifolia TaxID=37657 RepID=UPI003D780F79
MEEAGMRPYKVSYPGEYDPYELMRPSEDPRLGHAQKQKEEFYEQHGYSDDDDDDVDVGPFEDKIEDYYPNPPLPLVPRPPTTYSPSSPFTFLLPPLLHAEWVKSYKQNWKKTLKRDVKYEAKVLEKTDCDCVEAAINFYNQKHGTDYKIVETLGSYGCFDTGFWFHCNFRAQCCESDPSSPPKLFFAELNRIEYDQLIVKVCMPLDDGLGNRNSSIVRGCVMCGNHLLHPVKGFQAGRNIGG